MTTIERAIKTPIVVTLQGSDYEFTQFSLADWRAFTEHLKNERRKEINKSELPNSEKRILYSEWIQTPIDVDGMLNEAMTFTGMSWLLWHSVSRKHKDISEDAVMSLFDGILDATDVLKRVMGMPEDDESEDDGLGNEQANP